MHRYLWICHRRADRSFFYKGKQFPVCARCTGIWVGYGLGILLSLVAIPSWWVAIVLLLPMSLDVLTQLLHWRESTNGLRVLTGIAGGIAEIIILIQVLIYITQLGYSTGQAVL